MPGAALVVVDHSPDTSTTLPTLRLQLQEQQQDAGVCSSSHTITPRAVSEAFVQELLGPGSDVACAKVYKYDLEVLNLAFYQRSLWRATLLSSPASFTAYLFDDTLNHPKKDNQVNGTADAGVGPVFIRASCTASEVNLNWCWGPFNTPPTGKGRRVVAQLVPSPEKTRGDVEQHKCKDNAVEACAISWSTKSRSDPAAGRLHDYARRPSSTSSFAIPSWKPAAGDNLKQTVNARMKQFTPIVARKQKQIRPSKRVGYQNAKWTTPMESKPAAVHQVDQLKGDIVMIPTDQSEFQPHLAMPVPERCDQTQHDEADPLFPELPYFKKQMCSSSELHQSTSPVQAVERQKLIDMLMGAIGDESCERYNPDEDDEFEELIGSLMSPPQSDLPGVAHTEYA